MAATLVSAALTRAPTTRLAAARRPRPPARPRRVARLAPCPARSSRARDAISTFPTDSSPWTRPVRPRRAARSAPAPRGTASRSTRARRWGPAFPRRTRACRSCSSARTAARSCTSWTATPTSAGDDARGDHPRRERVDARLALQYPRFERGGADECAFDAPDIGVPRGHLGRAGTGRGLVPGGGGGAFGNGGRAPRARVPQTSAAGGVSSSASTSFPCGENVRDAVELRPSAFVKLTPEQRVEMRAEGLREYGALKVRMLAVTGAAVLLGCGVTASSTEPRERPRGDARRVRQRPRRRARLPLDAHA